MKIVRAEQVSRCPVCGEAIKTSEPGVFCLNKFHDQEPEYIIPNEAEDDEMFDTQVEGVRSMAAVLKKLGRGFHG